MGIQVVLLVLLRLGNLFSFFPCLFSLSIFFFGSQGGGGGTCYKWLGFKEGVET